MLFINVFFLLKLFLNIGKLKSLFILDLEKCNLEGLILDIIYGFLMRIKDIFGFLFLVLEE